MGFNFPMSTICAQSMSGGLVIPGDVVIDGDIEATNVLIDNDGVFGWVGDPDTFIYRASANIVGIDAGGSVALEVGAALATFSGRLGTTANGDVNDPAVFLGTEGNGLYRESSTAVAMSMGNTRTMSFYSDHVQNWFAFYPNNGALILSGQAIYLPEIARPTGVSNYAIIYGADIGGDETRVRAELNSVGYEVDVTPL